MPDANVKKAAEMLLAGATMVAQPCPYCSGVRVMKDGQALCVSCGSRPQEVAAPGVPDLEESILALTMRLGRADDPKERQRLMESISDLSKRLAGRDS